MVESHYSSPHKAAQVNCTNSDMKVLPDWVDNQALEDYARENEVQMGLSGDILILGVTGSSLEDLWPDQSGLLVIEVNNSRYWIRDTMNISTIHPLWLHDVLLALLKVCLSMPSRNTLLRTPMSNGNLCRFMVKWMLSRSCYFVCHMLFTMPAYSDEANQCWPNSCMQYLTSDFQE